MNIEALLQTYPRVRPPLTAAHKAVFAEQYKLNREGSRPVEFLAQKLEEWMHRRVAGTCGSPVLELGAGTLNHLRFELPTDEYDIVEPFHELYANRPDIHRIRTFYDRVADIPRQQSYTRVISIAVLEHMESLPAELALAAVRLGRNGVFQAGVPTEGSALWWLGWRFSTGMSYYFRTGLDYGTVMRHEHVNSSAEIEAFVNYLFADVRIQRFPFPWKHLSFYTYVEAKNPRIERCETIIQGDRPR